MTGAVIHHLHHVELRNIEKRGKFKAAGASTAECSTMKQFEVTERTVRTVADRVVL
jgi:hypothetical protein